MFVFSQLLCTSRSYAEKLSVSVLEKGTQFFFPKKGQHLVPATGFFPANYKPVPKIQNPSGKFLASEYLILYHI